MTDYSELKRLATKADQNQWCPDWTYQAVRHIDRNVDIECSKHPYDYNGTEVCHHWGRYDGDYVAAASPSVVLAILAELEALRNQKRTYVEIEGDWT